MPKVRAKQEDLSYTGPDPKVYRRYSENTKEKLWNLVIKDGMKPSSAAKLLKIKNSTAKMMIKKLRRDNESLDNPMAEDIQIKKEQFDHSGLTQDKNADPNQPNDLMGWVYMPVVILQYPFSTYES